MTTEKRDKILLGVTGATGMIYIPPFLECMQENNVEVHGVISKAGRQVLAYELGLGPEALSGIEKWYSQEDFTAPCASGSSIYRAMLILPCTMGTLGAIASGVCLNLIHRAADVTVKEKRPLVLAVRETPLNKTHLRNMMTAHDAGATIWPLMPSFYQQPKGLEQMAANTAGRICEQLGYRASGLRRWKGME